MNIKDSRILQLGKFYPIRGGVEKVMFDLTTGLSERGIKCDMLCAGLEGNTVDKVLNPNADLFCCCTWVKAYATTIAPSMILRLKKARKHYDIVHVHHPDPMACLALFLSGYKGKVVLHWHSDIEKQEFLLKLYRPLQSWLIRRADLIIGTTPIYTAESPFLQHVQDKVRCLPIGIEPVTPDAATVEALRKRYCGKKIVFSLGRLVGYKGYHYLVEATRHLTDNYIVLIGGDGVLQPDLEAHIDKLNVGAKVELLGRISDEDLPAYYGACDVFCLSSVQKTEAFGIVQLEAMSCGKPIVATKIPHSGVAWVNAHGESGLNVEPCNGKAIADAIMQISENRELYKRYCNGALNRYNTHFTKKTNIDNLLSIYSDLWKKQN